MAFRFQHHYAFRFRSVNASRVYMLRVNEVSPYVFYFFVHILILGLYIRIKYFEKV